MSVKIALTGKKFSGKTTAARALVESGFREYNFADPLKRLITDVFQIDEKYCYDPKYKEVVIEELGVSARQLMQTIGTELFRVELPKLLPDLKLTGNSVWIHSLLKRLSAETGNVVVGDCRFRDESEALTANKFKVVKITRNVDESTDTHISEQQDVGVTDEITNNGSIKDLHAKILNI